ncbi:MAG: hypothetical protein RL094_295 [Candidatus Parcubacteria bacterium]|jgi:hypothetical protein
MRPPLDWKKYLFTFILTLIIFGSALYINNKLDEKRFADIRSVQDEISLDLLSSEAQFDLLKEASCKNLTDSVLSTELNSLATKLSYLESNQNRDNSELLFVKKNYSLLEIKDYLLMKQINEKCKSKPIAVLYFYTDKENCPDCEKMGYVLSYLREQYPQLRIYSFDFNLKLSAIDTLKSVYKLDDRKLPAIVYNEDTFYGFNSIDQVKEIIPELKKIDKVNAASSSNALLKASSSTSTKAKN